MTSLNWATYGCLSISYILILFIGLNCNIFTTKSIASTGVSDLNQSFTDFILGILTDLIIVYAHSASNESMSFWVGWPVKAKILSNWLSVEFPGKNGLPINISAKIQPILQISAEVP